MRNAYCQKVVKRQDRGHRIAVLISFLAFVAMGILVIVQNGF